MSTSFSRQGTMSNLRRSMAQRQQKLALASHSEPGDATNSAAGALRSGQSFVSQNLAQEPLNGQQNVNTFNESKTKKEKEEVQEEVTDTNEATGSTDTNNEDMTKVKKDISSENEEEEKEKKTQKHRQHQLPN